MSKSFFLLFLVSLLLIPVVDTAAAGQVNTFIYHRFDESRYPSTNIAADIFVQQLEYLKEHNYQVVSLGEVVRRLKNGEALPEKGAALCIDDAFRSFAEVAMPLFRQYGYPVTLFVNTDAVGTRGYLNWAEIKALYEEGVEIGNHTATHDYLVELKKGESFADWRERIKADIGKAQEQFKKHLGFDPPLFVYPYGEYSPEIIEIVKEFGFAAAFAQQSGVIHSRHDLYTLPRFPMGGPYATLKGFISKLQMRPLVVLEEEPVSPVVTDNPPELLVRISSEQVDMGRVNCFVQGDNSCQIKAVAGRDGWYRVIAEDPVGSRRNKYTLTVPGKKGGWYWYSHLWLNAKSPASKNSQPAEATGSAAQPEADIGKPVEAIKTDQ
jgi:peptidoglycan/xylan/chitin deacetylase (PgdA/CDA1 family)